MAERRLTPDEAEIWAKVVAGVRRIEKPGNIISPAVRSQRNRGALPSEDEVARRDSKRVLDFAGTERKSSVPTDTLDGGWDRRLRRGMVQPERSVDLHGHNLISAHAYLDTALDRAITDGIRTLLVVTGKPPRDPAPHRRGLIRASIGDWLASSRHAGRIAAVRNAHPRHGGAGALYIILRRARSE